jgi:predicted  nucleic acid-binding Zn-ribbon protein
MSIENDLLALKSKGEQLNNLRVANQTKLQGLEQEKEKLLLEAKELGIAPEAIEATLKSEEAAIQAEVSALQEQLDKVLSDIRSI